VSDEKELEAVVREFDGAMSSANSKAAARLILEARRERDEALARVQELEREKGGATWDCDVLGHAERIAELEAELKSETEEAEGYQKALHAAWAERDGARERTLLECAQHMARVFCEKCAYENNQWLRVALDGDEGLGKERDRLMAERDAAVAEMCSLAKQLGQCQVERDTAPARVRDLEREKGGTTWTELRAMAAEGAANARLRAAFERWQHTVIPLTPEATTRHRVRLADDLRAALTGEEK
jgi:chromosome segregation ATPase